MVFVPSLFAGPHLLILLFQQSKYLIFPVFNTWSLYKTFLLVVLKELHKPLHYPCLVLQKPTSDTYLFLPKFSPSEQHIIQQQEYGCQGGHQFFHRNHPPLCPILWSICSSMQAESYHTVIESNSTSDIFKTDGKIFPAPVSGIAGITHNYMLSIFSQNRTGSERTTCPVSCLWESPNGDAQGRCDTSFLCSSSFHLSAVQRAPDLNLVSTCVVTPNGFIFNEFPATLPYKKHMNLLCFFGSASCLMPPSSCIGRRNQQLIPKLPLPAVQDFMSSPPIWAAHLR